MGIYDDNLAVENGARHLEQLNCFDKVNKLLCPVFTVPTPKRHAATVDLAEHSVAIELQFMKPFGRRMAALDGYGELRRDEAGQFGLARRQDPLWMAIGFKIAAWDHTVYMIFAIFDYIQYRRRAGRYQRDINKSGSLMGRSFNGKIPGEIIARLRPGDLICIQNFDWWVSWAIMYLTGSSISHVAFYLGDGVIGHMTLDGAVKEPVERLWKSDARFLPFIWFMSDRQRQLIEASMDELSAVVYYDCWLLVRKALRILSGRAWGSFRWTLFADVVFSTALLDLVTVLVVGIPVFSALLVPYTLLLIVNRLRFTQEPVLAGSPEELINGLFRTGRGTPLLDLPIGGVKPAPSETASSTGEKKKGC